MNIRNCLFNIVPDRLLKNIVKRRIKGKGVALMYHEVLPDLEGPAAWTVVRESSFKEQMLYLKEYFDIVTIDEALTKASSVKDTGRPYALVTFDDGYKGNLTCMLPMIEELQIPVTVYISTHAVETGTVYWYDKVIPLLDRADELTLDLSKYELGIFKLNGSKNEK